MNNGESPSRGRRPAGMLGLAVAAGLMLPIPALAQDAAQLAAGKMVWTNGGCANCHGNQGQGGTSADYPQGPSLRTGALDRAGLIEIISCGVPGTRMPGWLKGAYTESACFGLEIGPPPARTMVVGAFDAEEIEALVDYIQTTFVQPK